MKRKPINLCLWMFLKTIPAALLVLYYWMCTLEGYAPVFRYLHAVTLVLAIGLAWGHDLAMPSAGSCLTSLPGESQADRLPLFEDCLSPDGRSHTGLCLCRLLRDRRRILCGLGAFCADGGPGDPVHHH